MNGSDRAGPTARTGPPQTDVFRTRRAKWLFRLAVLLFGIAAILLAVAAIVWARGLLAPAATRWDDLLGDEARALLAAAWGGLALTAGGIVLAIGRFLERGAVRRNGAEDGQ